MCTTTRPAGLAHRTARGTRSRAHPRFAQSGVATRLSLSPCPLPATPGLCQTARAAHPNHPVALHAHPSHHHHQFQWQWHHRRRRRRTSRAKCFWSCCSRSTPLPRLPRLPCTCSSSLRGQSRSPWPCPCHLCCGLQSQARPCHCCHSNQQGRVEEGGAGRGGTAAYGSRRTGSAGASTARRRCAAAGSACTSTTSAARTRAAPRASSRCSTTTRRPSPSRTVACTPTGLSTAAVRLLLLLPLRLLHAVSEQAQHSRTALDRPCSGAPASPATAFRFCTKPLSIDAHI